MKRFLLAALVIVVLHALLSLYFVRYRQVEVSELNFQLKSAAVFLPEHRDAIRRHEDSMTMAVVIYLSGAVLLMLLGLGFVKGSASAAAARSDPSPASPSSAPPRKHGWVMALVVAGYFLGGGLVGYYLAGGESEKKAKALPRYTASVPKPEYWSKGPDKVPEHARGLYLDLMKRSLTDLIYEDDPQGISKRAKGLDWPGRAVTMVGLARLDHLHSCAEDVLANGVPGDFLEAGAWRGGATIFMRAVLKEYGDRDRVVWVADSFEGLPPPDPKYPVDAGSTYHEYDALAVSLEEVKANFDRFGLLDDQVRFLKGWFKDTFPTAPIKQLAILRLDGDMYESTMDSLVPLYPKVSSGGYVIVDDYFAISACRQATDDYRKKHGITEEIKRIDWAAAYWKKK